MSCKIQILIVLSFLMVASYFFLNPQKEPFNVPQLAENQTGNVKVDNNSAAQNDTLGIEKWLLSCDNIK